MSTGLPQQSSARPDRRLYNYRIDVYHQGVNLGTTILELDDLKLLLDVRGYLRTTNIESWLGAIFSSVEPLEFTLVNKSTVTFIVTITLELSTSSTLLTH